MIISHTDCDCLLSREGSLQDDLQAEGWELNLHAKMSHKQAPVVVLSVPIPSVLPAHPKGAETFMTWTSNGFPITPPELLSSSVLD